MYQHGQPVVTVWMGPIVAVHEGSVESTEGETLAYRCYLVEPETLSIVGLAGSTVDTTIYLFPMPEVVRSYQQALVQIRATNQSPSLLGQCLVGELWDEFHALGTEEFEAFLSDQLIQTLLAHELQHVRDRRLLQAAARADLAPEETDQLLALIEARGGLRQIADGTLPLLSLGQIATDWTPQLGTYSSAAKMIEAAYGGDFGRVTLDPDTVRSQALAGLAALPYGAAHGDNRSR